MSRTDPLAPAKPPASSRVANAMNSAGMGPAVAVQEVDPAAQLAVLRGIAQAGVQSISATSRELSWTSAPKCLPRRSSGFQPVSRSHVSETNVNRASASDRPDEVRRILDEVAVAALGLAEQLVQVGVRQRDRGLVGEALEEVELVGAISRGVRYEIASVR
jgi:hypothetical protein